MTSTDTGRSLLNAILVNPDDDLHRLVYTDWLEDNGQFLSTLLKHGSASRISESASATNATPTLITTFLP